MVGITLLTVVLWRTKHVPQQAGAAVLFLESLAVSGLAVQFVVRLLSGSASSAVSPLRSWLPAVAGVALAALATAVRSKGLANRPIVAGPKS